MRGPATISKRPPEVLLVYDDPEWIGGHIARRLAQRVEDKVKVTLLSDRDAAFEATFVQQQHRHDVVHFLFPQALYRMARYVALPCVATIWHLMSWDELVTNLRYVDVLCTGSAQWMRRLAERVPASLGVRRFEYGVDVDVFRHDPTAKLSYLARGGRSLRTVTLGFAGSPKLGEYGRKGVDRMVECLAALRSCTQGCVLLILTGRDWTLELFPPAVRKHVVIEPFMPAAAMPSFYSVLDYFICTSREEGVPYPLLEAMSCECVVMCTPVGVAPELLRCGENGFLLTGAEIAEQCVSVVEATLSDEGYRRRIGASARSSVCERFDWNSPRVADVYAGIVETALEHGQVRATGKVRRAQIAWLRAQWSRNARRWAARCRTKLRHTVGYR